VSAEGAGSVAQGVGLESTPCRQHLCWREEDGAHCGACQTDNLPEALSYFCTLAAPTCLPPCRYIARTLGGGDEVFHVAEDYSDLVWHNSHLDYNQDPGGCCRGCPALLVQQCCRCCCRCCCRQQVALCFCLACWRAILVHAQQCTAVQCPLGQAARPATALPTHLQCLLT
jgi:hypothetical protein